MTVKHFDTYLKHIDFLFQSLALNNIVENVVIDSFQHIYWNYSRFNRFNDVSGN